MAFTHSSQYGHGSRHGFGAGRLALAALLLLALALVLAGCKDGDTDDKAEHASQAASMAQAKYVFLFIGDGMGIPQRTAAEQYVGHDLAMNGFPAQGVTTTMANDRFITGSAASATAMASGKKTNINYIGVDPDLKPMKTLAELAKEQGKKVAVISSVSIDHATPAAFYAHVKTRKMYHEIDHALAESGFDFFGGGGLKDPTGKKSKESLGDAVQKAEANGYTFITNKADFEALTPDSGKVVVINEWLQDSKALPYVMDMSAKDITLPELTAKAIEMLDNEQGFFMMVEGGKIDWACHANDGTASIINTLSFDDAVRVAVEFYNAHPDETLIVVSGDHECGGLTLGFAGTGYESYFDVLKSQKVSFQQFSDEVVPSVRDAGGHFEDIKPLITDNFGLKFTGNADEDMLVLTDHEQAMVLNAFLRSMKGENVSGGQEEYVLYGEYDPLTVTLTHILNNKAGLAWTSYKHTGVPVSTSALGVGAELFNGYYDNTDIALRIMQAMGAGDSVQYFGQAQPTAVAAN